MALFVSSKICIPFTMQSDLPRRFIGDKGHSKLSIKWIFPAPSCFSLVLAAVVVCRGHDQDHSRFIQPLGPFAWLTHRLYCMLQWWSLTKQPLYCVSSREEDRMCPDCGITSALARLAWNGQGLPLPFRVLAPYLGVILLVDLPTCTKSLSSLF
jgi:hypothetical protein